MILAIETATDVCSVACRDEGGEIHEKRTEQKGSHSEQLFIYTRELMKELDFRPDRLEAVLVSEGPGSYTGLRIAASAVKGLLFSTGVPLYAANTLASFAAGVMGSGGADAGRADAGPPQVIHSVIDARRVHLYHQSFRAEAGALEAEDRVEVLPIDKVQQMLRPGHLLVGSGIERMEKAVVDQVTPMGTSHISARSLLRLYGMADAGEFLHRVEPSGFDPRYYRSGQV